MYFFLNNFLKVANIIPPHGIIRSIIKLGDISFAHKFSTQYLNSACSLQLILIIPIVWSAGNVKGRISCFLSPSSELPLLVIDVKGPMYSEEMTVSLGYTCG